MAESAGRSRKKQRINKTDMPWRARGSPSAAVMPSISAPSGPLRAVCVCGSKKISAWRTLSAAARRSDSTVG